VTTTAMLKNRREAAAKSAQRMQKHESGRAHTR
jgi:hypothetical protein